MDISLGKKRRIWYNEAVKWPESEWEFRRGLFGTTNDDVTVGAKRPRPRPRIPIQLDPKMNDSLGCDSRVTESNAPSFESLSTTSTPSS
jgi:hypothetical protein